MIYRTSTRSINNSTHRTNDTTRVIVDNKTVYNDGVVNFVKLTYLPKGEIISLVIYGVNGEDLSLDGKFNMVLTRVEFLPDEVLTGRQCEIKYIIGAE